MPDPLAWCRPLSSPGNAPWLRAEQGWWMSLFFLGSSGHTTEYTGGLMFLSRSLWSRWGSLSALLLTFLSALFFSVGAHPVQGNMLLLTLARMSPFFLSGLLVWCAAADRRSAAWLCAAFSALMLSFAPMSIQPAVLSVPPSVALACATAFLCLFLVTFPHDYTQTFVASHPAWAQVQSLMVRVLGSAALGIAALAVLCWPFPTLSGVVNPCALLLSMLNLAGCCCCWMLAYVGTEAPRERQQLRLILTGTLLSLVPCVLLNVLAHAFPFLALPGFVRILPVLCFPLALGYALLRPQLFLLERVVNHITRWFLRGLALPLVVALLLAVGQHAYPDAPLSRLLFLLVAVALLTPLLWGGTRLLAAWLWEQEVRELLSPVTTLPKPANEEEAVLILTSALSLVSGTSQICVCLCLSDEHTLLPFPRLRQNGESAERMALLQRAHTFWGLSLERHEPAGAVLKMPPELQVILKGQPPLLHQRWHAGTPGTLTHALLALWQRFATLSVSPASETLLVPLATQGRLLGLVLLSSRSDGLAYTGADAEAIVQVIQRAAPLVEQAHLAADKRRQDVLLAQIYTRLATLHTIQPPLDVLRSYARLAASLEMSVEVYWSHSTSAEPVLRDGVGPWLQPEERHLLLAAGTNPSFFSSGQGTLSCATACFPFLAQHCRGTFLLTYTHPHTFTPREQDYLTVLVQHCQATLEAADRMYPHDTPLISTPQEQAPTPGPASGTLHTPSALHDELATLCTALAGFVELTLHEATSATTRQACVRDACQTVQRLAEVLQEAVPFPHHEV